MTTTTTTEPRQQSFALVVGESYRVLPPRPRDRKPGVTYLSGIHTLLAVYADGTAKFGREGSEGFTVKLSHNRVWKY